MDARYNCTAAKDVARRAYKSTHRAARSPSEKKNPEVRRDEGTRARLVVWQSDFYSQRVAVTERSEVGTGREEDERWKDKQMDKCECVQERN